jgi:carboxymethylenebutenolidase
LRDDRRTGSAGADTIRVRAHDGAMTRASSEEPMSKTISYPRPDGQSVDGYLAEPAGAAGAPGIVVIQEWWGLNDQIRGVADRLAAAGYRALVPDLYRGQVALEAHEAEHLMKGLNFGDAAGQDVRGAVQYLKASGSRKVGVTGFCMGGALTLLSACHVPELDAACTWYGYPPLEFVDAAKIKAPLMGHWATDDAAFAISGVDTLEGKLRAAGVGHEFFRYDCKHAFANETADSKNLPFLKYDPQAAELAWKRTMDFFGGHLR